MKKYLLFDLDGTLTDPKVGITTCVQYALKALGIEEPNLDKLEPFIGPPLKESFMQFYGLDDAQAEEAVTKYRDRFQNIGIFENKVYKGVPVMLRVLKAKGMHLAVASSKPTVFVERILEHFHIKQYFEVIVGSELDGTRVNKDEVVQEALKQLFHGKPILREQVYMIGDRKFDVEGAKTHRVESVGVAYGYGSMKELKEAKADYIVHSVEELRRFLLRNTDDRGADNRDEGNCGTDGVSIQPETENVTFIQIVWALAMPLLIFQAVRMLIMSIFYGVVHHAGNFMIASDGNVQNVMSTVAFVAAGLVILPHAKEIIARTSEDIRQWRKEPKRNYIFFGVTVWGATMGFNLLFNLTGITGHSVSYQEAAAQQYAGSFVLGLLCYTLISPVAEELLFRGIIYGQLRRFAGVKMAIPVSAILFGLYHMNMVQALYGFLLGCLIAYGYEYFGDFKMAVFMHMLANLLAYVFTGSSLFSSRAVSWVSCIVCLTAMMVCVLILHRSKNVFRDRH